MSNTDILRRSEAELLPPGFILDHVFSFGINGYEAIAEVDGFHPVSREAIEICQSASTNGTPKPGQKRKLASDVLKLIFLKDLGLISRGRVFITSPEMYTWCQQSGSWLNAARRHYHIDVILTQHPSKTIRKQVRNALMKARKEKS
jgi:hypothetical protein